LNGFENELKTIDSIEPDKIELIVEWANSILKFLTELAAEIRIELSEDNISMAQAFKERLLEIVAEKQAQAESASFR
jgi:hypothetical protein